MKDPSSWGMEAWRNLVFKWFNFLTNWVELFQWVLKSKEWLTQVNWFKNLAFWGFCSF